MLASLHRLNILHGLILPRWQSVKIFHLTLWTTKPIIFKLCAYNPAMIFSLYQSASSTITPAGDRSAATFSFTFSETIGSISC